MKDIVASLEPTLSIFYSFFVCSKMKTCVIYIIQWHTWALKVEVLSLTVLVKIMNFYLFRFLKTLEAF